MSRRISEKYIQQHDECKCGHNVVIGYYVTHLTYKYLRTNGYKFRRDKKTGERFFTTQTFSDCKGEREVHNDYNNEDYFN